MGNKSKSRAVSNTADYCDPYCICPRCGAGPTSVKPQYRHIYWPDKFDKEGKEIK